MRLNNARVELEDVAEEMDPERWAGIKEYVFPLLEAEGARLSAECRRLRGDT